MIIIPLLLLGVLGLASLVSVVYILLRFFLWLNGDIITRKMEIYKSRNKEEE